MATKYTFKFTDALKSEFSIYPYTTNGPVSPTDGTAMEYAVSADTTLKLYGKGMQEYGEGIEQNLIYMLENFASSIIPVNSTEGQLWYNNVGTGSPQVGPELFIRNSNVNDDISTGWDAVILASGTSTMTGDLILSGIPTNPAAAIPLSALQAHELVDNLHLTPEQNEFLDALDIFGSPPTLIATDVNQLSGITSNVQTQLNDKISRTGDTMDSGANLLFNNGNIDMQNSGSPIGVGEVIGLPDIPSVSHAAASKAYVDNQLAAGLGGDGVLTTANWISSGGGSPLPNPIFDTIQLEVQQFGFPLSTFTLEGISRIGHVHDAINITFDNTFDGLYPINVQDAIEYVDTNKADLLNPTFSGTVNVSGDLVVTGGGSFVGQVSAGEPVFGVDLATKNYVDTQTAGVGEVGTAVFSITRTFDSLTSTLATPTPYAVQEHTTNDNKLNITINGIKQYAHVNAEQNIQYDANVGLIDFTTYTGLDTTRTYDFAISVDGAGPVTVTIPAGTPLATHFDLITAINNAMQTGSPVLAQSIFELTTEFTTVETFKSYSSGSSSTIAISDPATGGSPFVQYLFATDPAPTAIIGATFLSNPPPDGGSPIPIPDTIEIAGDVTANFPVGKTFTIRGSVDPLYETFDGVYSVHINGATVSGSPLVTSVPIAQVENQNFNDALLPLYQPFGSPLPPAPSPSAYGSVHFTPIGGFDQILTASVGIDGDYLESNSAGDVIPPGELTDYVVFNVNITSGSKIETLLLR